MNTDSTTLPCHRFPLRRLAQALLAAVALAGAAADRAEEAPASARPNVVFFLVDDLGFMDIGANNPGTFYETPNIDALAERGVRFTDGYAACPVCSPTRSAIMTGKYPPRTGITDFHGGPQPTDPKQTKKMIPAPYA
ncbi:MAG: sulfatase-like hydrolase/transferase, partial [Opitutaceae bacterium]